MLSIVVIVIGWSHVSGFFQLNLPAQKEVNENEIKILSYNVRLFDLYNWSNNVQTRDKIFDFLKEQDADILCFQEFYYDETRNFETLDTLLKFQKAIHEHTAYTHTARNKYHFGIATFSKYPIVRKGELKFSNTKNICIYSDIIIDNDTIRLYNNHLESIHFQPEHYNLIDSITYKNETERLEGFKDIMYRLKNAYGKRAGQSEVISEHIQNSPYPVLVCGDFNDTHVSYTYRLLSQDLTDAFKQNGLGFGATYNRKFFFLRIDYLLYSPEIEFRYYKTIKNNYSDHNPITGIFKISPNTH